MADPKSDPKTEPRSEPQPGEPASAPPADPAPAVSEDSYEMVKQACAMAIQDAVAYLRNTQVIANAVIGVASQRLLIGPDDGAAAKAIAAAGASVTAAAEALTAISTATASTLKQFPHG